MEQPAGKIRESLTSERLRERVLAQLNGAPSAEELRRRAVEEEVKR